MRDFQKELISDASLAANAQEHLRERAVGPHILPAYGMSGYRWIPQLDELANRIAKKDARLSVLDYGAGKGTLAHALRHSRRFEVRNYDPVTFPDEPAPADIVVVTDVIEFIEPDKILSVLAHIDRLAIRAVLFVSPYPPRAKVAWHAAQGLHVTRKSPEQWAKILVKFWPTNAWTRLPTGANATPRFIFRGLKNVR